MNSGSASSTACGSTARDKHLFYNYGISIPAGSTIHGIKVQLDAFVDSISNTPTMCVDLSWDGGTTWTSSRATPTLTTTEATYILGGQSDDWGRTWSNTELEDATFQVRVTPLAGSKNRDFFLDWVPVIVDYTP